MDKIAEIKKLKEQIISDFKEFVEAQLNKEFHSFNEIESFEFINDSQLSKFTSGHGNNDGKRIAISCYVKLKK